MQSEGAYSSFPRSESSLGMVPVEHLLKKQDVSGKRCLLRVDLNIKNVSVGNQRLQQHGRVVRMLRDAGVKTLILSHKGRPDGYDASLSLRDVAEVFAKDVLGSPVSFLSDPVSNRERARHAFDTLANGEVMVAENMRFYPQERANDQEFARYLGSLGDFYVGDAFSIVHRKHATVASLPRYLPSFAGCSLLSEMKHLTDTLYHSQRPLMLVFGGAKISTKLPALLHLIGHVDKIAVMGTLGSLLLSAMGIPLEMDVEASLCDLAKDICRKVRLKKQKLLLPLDGIMREKDGTIKTATMGQSFLEQSFLGQISGRQVSGRQVSGRALMLDIGPRTCSMLIKELKESKTLIWNGPLGMYEDENFAQGTQRFGEAVVAQTKTKKLFTLVGGGDTDTALRTFGYHKDLNHISTGGGVTLDWLAGRPLPGILALEKCANAALTYLHKGEPLSASANVSSQKEQAVV